MSKAIQTALLTDWKTEREERQKWSDGGCKTEHINLSCI